MRKNSLRYKALKRCAQVNENVAVDLLKLKRAGVDVKNFVNQVENIDAPYSILENYNFMSIDDVDVHDIKESLMELGASRKLLSEAVYEADDVDNVLINKAIEFINKSVRSSERDALHRRKNLPDAEYIEDENGLYRNDNSPYMRLLVSRAMGIGYTLYKKYGINTKNNWWILDDYFRDLIHPKKGNDEYNEVERDLISWTLDYLRDLIYDIHKDLWQRREKMIVRGEDIDESYSFKNRRKMLRESKKELDPKADLKKRQAELDKIVEEIKNDANLDKKSAKKYTTRLKKIKDLKELKKAKSIVKKLSKLYPEAADLLNEATVLKFVNAVRGKKAVLNENLKINNFHISTYSLKELKECYSKVAKNINVLKRKLRKSALNESYTAADIRKIKEELKKQTKLYGMLDEEISWKMLILQKGGLDKVRFINEGDDSKDEKEENAEDAASTSLDDLFNNIGDEMEDNIEKEEESDEKKEDKNDSDEDVELDSITITMKSEDAANALKDALIEKGIPEDAIDVEEAEEEEDESKNESVKYSNKFMRLFEDEELTEEDEADNNEEESNDDNSEEASDDDSNDDNSEDKAYNVTLTDTDYVNSLKDVMVDEYGYTEDEFWDSIGGKPVDDEEDSDNKDNEESDKDDSDNKDNEEDDDTSELDSIGADIFGEQ